MKKPVENEMDGGYVKCKDTTPERSDFTEWAFWDYKKYSRMKKIERTAMLFPQIGRDKKTVIELYKNIGTFDIPSGNKKLIKLYYKLIKKGELS